MIEEGGLNVLYSFAAMTAIGLVSLGISALMIDRNPAKRLTPNRAARRQKMR